MYVFVPVHVFLQNGLACMLQTLQEIQVLICSGQVMLLQWIKATFFVC